MANSHEPYTNREETTNGYSTNVTYINDMPDDSGSGQGTVFSIISKHLIFLPNYSRQIVDWAHFWSDQKGYKFLAEVALAG